MTQSKVKTIYFDFPGSRLLKGTKKKVIFIFCGTLVMIFCKNKGKWDINLNPIRVLMPREITIQTGQKTEPDTRKKVGIYSHNSPLKAKNLSY